MDNIGTEIHRKFKESGMTAVTFAERLNISRENVYSIFRRKKIDVDMLKRISSVLGYDFISLLYATQKPSSSDVIILAQVSEQTLNSLKSNPDIQIHCILSAHS
jgi:predicted transcriptional regulator